MDMDDDTRTLIAGLLVRAGMLMEDLSAAAIRALPAAPTDTRDHINEIALGGAGIGLLTLAAWYLAELSGTASRLD